MADTATVNEKAQPDPKAAADSGEPLPPPASNNRRFVVIGVILLLVIGAIFLAGQEN